MQPLQPSSRQTLLGKSQWPISNATGVRIMRGMFKIHVKTGHKKESIQIWGQGNRGQWTHATND